MHEWSAFMEKKGITRRMESYWRGGSHRGKRKSELGSYRNDESGESLSATRAKGITWSKEWGVGLKGCMGKDKS